MNMFVFINDSGHFCIRKVGEPDVAEYSDFRLFVSDLKVRLENEKEVSDSSTIAKESPQPFSGVGTVERRKGFTFK